MPDRVGALVRDAMRGVVRGGVRAAMFCAAAAFGLTLAACGEKPQAMDASAKKVDAEPWTATDAANPAFYAKGWKIGDKTAWEEQMRKRNQAQNDYAPR